MLAGQVADMLAERQFLGAARSGQLELAGHGRIDGELADRPVQHPFQRRLAAELALVRTRLIADRHSDRVAAVDVVTRVMMVTMNRVRTVRRLVLAITHDDEVFEQHAVILRDERQDVLNQLAGADIEAGSKVFKKCAACHKINGENGIGPHLDGVVGRPIASVEDFKYSDVMAGLGGDWTPERLSEFLAKPRDFAPGTAMSFAGLRKDEEIVNVIGYLNSLQN